MIEGLFKKTMLLAGKKSPVKIVLALSFVFWLVTCPLIGQEKPKKDLSEEDYHLWGHLSFKDVSSDGLWVSYKMVYDGEIDTLFVKNTSNKVSYAFPKAVYGVFGKSNWFAVHSPKGLELLDLNRGNRVVLTDVSSWGFSALDDMLVVLIQSNNCIPYLKIIRPHGETLIEIPYVTEFQMSPDKKRLGYVTHNENKSILGIIALNKFLKNRTVSTANTTGYFHHLVWDKNGLGMAFLNKENRESTDNSLMFFNISEWKLKTFSPEKAARFPQNSYISYTTNHRLTISDDLKRIFFAIKSKEIDVEQTDTLCSTVQIWNGNDAWTYKQRERSKNWFDTRVGVWNLSSNHFFPISSDTLPYLMLSGDQKSVISFDPKPKEVHFEFNDPIDFFITDLKTERTRLFLKNQEHNMSYIIPSPEGTYIVYFKENHWWVYDIQKDAHRKITQSINSHFENELNDNAGKKEPYGIAGWTIDDRSVIVYDRFDLWEINPKTGEGKRLTNGKEREIQFRMAPDRKTLHVPNFNGFFSKIIDTQAPLLLYAKGEDSSSGYFLRTRSSEIQKINYSESLLDQAIPYDNGIICQDQRFDSSPRIINCKYSLQKSKLVYQSNPHQSDYNWGTAKYIQYQNSLKDTLKGFLCFPANYQPDKQYPMIVHIYERQFRNFHMYIAPSLYNSVGFNPTNFSAQGYFVLYPDIIYELGKPGYSALDCVTAAVKKVLDMGLVEKDKIGLIGHSFGGYETDFIMTQSDLFATAVSGAASTDLQSHYLNLNGITGQPDIWRFENQQWRIGKSLFQDTNAYVSNSPLTFAKNIKVPILSWSGLKDYQVDFHQSIEWYLALRRLGKKHISLYYPEEPHWLLDPVNQIDLSKRIEGWFSHFLKDAFAEPWMKKGLE